MSNKLQSFSFLPPEEFDIENRGKPAVTLEERKIVERYHALWEETLGNSKESWPMEGALRLKIFKIISKKPQIMYGRAQKEIEREMMDIYEKTPKGKDGFLERCKEAKTSEEQIKLCTTIFLKRISFLKGIRDGEKQFVVNNFTTLEKDIVQAQLPNTEKKPLHIMTATRQVLHAAIVPKNNLLIMDAAPGRSGPRIRKSGMDRINPRVASRNGKGRNH